jgi:predicted NBD/HSP70 family sugar kinase
VFEGTRNLKAHDDTDYLVADVGGTHLRVGRFNRSTGLALGNRRIITPSFETMPEASSREIFAAIANELQILASDLDLADPSAIGIAFAGPVDDNGQVYAAPTILGQPLPEPLELLSFLQPYWPRTKIWIINDVTAAGMFYADGTNSNFCIVTVSSGIGCKVFLRGQPVLGNGWAGGEIGHWRVDHRAEAMRCDCGGIGHLGAVASGRGALRFFHRQTGDQGLTSYDLVRSFHAGDPLAINVVSVGAASLARGLALIHLAVGIERFIIYGGFAAALGERYREILAEETRALCWGGADDWQGRVELHEQDDISLHGLGRHISKQVKGSNHI